MSDNPFLRPAPPFQTRRDEATVMIPNPGGRPPGELPPASPAAPSDEAGPSDIPFAGQPPLLAAAAPLLLLLARLRTAQAPPDPKALRQRTLTAIRRFEQQAEQGGIAADVAHPARYVLCATLDDLVLNTQWGRSSSWAQASLVSTLHQEVISGERFYELLDGLKREPMQNLQLLTLMYFCLSLGYEGQYRLLERGRAILDSLREDLHGILKRFGPPVEPALSAQWEGQAAPYRPVRPSLPVWVMTLVGLLLLMLAWGGLRLWLSPGSTRVADAAAAMEPQHAPGLERIAPAPPPPPHPPDPLLGRLKFLGADIAAGRVSVEDTRQGVRIRLFDLGHAGLFASGQAELRPGFVPMLRSIGDALNDEQGRIELAGHTDDRPIHTYRFPGNFELSLARAVAAASALKSRLADPSRVHPAGYAAQAPVESNETETGRAHNRRIEIVLMREPG